MLAFNFESRFNLSIFTKKSLFSNYISAQKLLLKKEKGPKFDFPINNILFERFYFEENIIHVKQFRTRILYDIDIYKETKWYGTNQDGLFIRKNKRIDIQGLSLSVQYFY